MISSLRILAFFVHIDAAKDPVPALLVAGGVGVALWFVVSQARRREVRRSQARRERDDRQPRNW